jgi:hypothetical protein
LLEGHNRETPILQDKQEDGSLLRNTNTSTGINPRPHLSVLVFEDAVVTSLHSGPLLA